MRREPKPSPFLGRLSRWWLPETTPPRLLLYFVGTAVFTMAWALWGPFVGAPAARNAAVALGIVSLSGAVLVLTFAMALPGTDGRLRRHHRRLLLASKVISVILVVCTLFMSAAMIPWIYVDGNLSILGRIELQPSTSDAIATTHQANELLLDGENPYGKTNVFEAMEGFATVRPTFLRRGAFADAYPGPTEDEVDAALAAAMADPDEPAPEFESTLAYPAGAFLLRVPTDALGIPPQWFYLACAALIVVLIVWRAPPPLRPVAIIAGGSAMLLWNSHFGGGMDSLYLLFLLLGWTLRKRLWLAAVLIGIACACKQTAWFFLPFYLVLVLREAGWRKAAGSAAVIGGVFLLINLPFIAADPGTWTSSMLSPMTDPLFPYGIGPVSFAMLSHTPVPSVIFTALEAAAMIAALAWYCRHCRQAPQAGLLLAVVPLFFAWRSLVAYFVAIPLIVLGAILMEEGRGESALPPEPAAASAI